MKEQKTNNILDFNFLYDYILVEPQELKSTVGELIKPNQYDDKSEYGIVVRVGNGRLMEDGTVVPLMVKEGDTILFNKYGTTKIHLDGKDYLSMREYDIVAVNPCIK